MPIYAFGPPFFAAHVSWRFMASDPMSGKRGRKEVLKPVAQIMASTLWKVPEERRMPVGVTSLMDEVATSTFGWQRAGR